MGTNNRQAVLYLLEGDEREMLVYERRRLFDALDPQRPTKQHCVIAASGPWAINLPADFIRAVIRLDFDLSELIGPGIPDLFPNPEDDRFLRALINHDIPHVTSFGGDVTPVSHPAITRVLW